MSDNVSYLDSAIVISVLASVGFVWESVSDFRRVRSGFWDTDPVGRVGERRHGLLVQVLFVAAVSCGLVGVLSGWFVEIDQDDRLISGTFLGITLLTAAWRRWFRRGRPKPTL